MSLQERALITFPGDSTPLLSSLHKGSVRGRQSSFVTVLALWNTMIGTSVLSLPWAVREAGLACGMVCLLVMGVLMAYTSYLVLQSIDSFPEGRTLEFHDVCGHFLGRWAKLLAITGSLLSLCGGMLVYWILLSNFLFHIGTFVHGRIFHDIVSSCNMSAEYDNAVCRRAENMSSPCSTEPHNSSHDDHHQHHHNHDDNFQTWWSETGTIPLFLVLLLFPLLNFKSAAFFTKVNSFGMMSLVYLVIFVAVKAASWGVNVEFKVKSQGQHSHYAQNFQLTFPALTGVAALGFVVHNSLLTIVRNQKHPYHNVRDLFLAYGLVIATYVYMGGVFYVTFPLNKNCIGDNLLDNLASSDTLALAARAGMFVQLACIFPQLTFIARLQIFGVVFGKPWPRLQIVGVFFDKPWPSVFHVLGLNVVLVTTCVLFAVYLPHIGRIIGFVGALCGFYYAIGLPCLVRCASLRAEGRLKAWHVVFHSALVLVGLANFVAQFFMISPT